MDNSIFQVPWQRIISATESLAQSHETLAQEIEADVERPLREYATRNQEMQAMLKIQNDLAALAKELQTAQKKVDKLKEKGPKAAGKTSVAVSAAEDVNQQWESRAPYAFEKLQAIDENRINHLRDVLTQFETHEVDQIERNRHAAEGCLNVLLNIETAEEIRMFAAKVSGRQSTNLKRQDVVGAGSGFASASTSASAAATLPPPPKIHDDDSSQHSGRSNQGRLGASMYTRICFPLKQC